MWYLLKETINHICIKQIGILRVYDTYHIFETCKTKQELNVNRDRRNKKVILTPEFQCSIYLEKLKKSYVSLTNRKGKTTNLQPVELLLLPRQREALVPFFSRGREKTRQDFQ